MDATHSNPPEEPSRPTGQEPPFDPRANEDMRTLLYAMSHDLKGPTSTVANFVDLIQQEYGALFDARGERWLEHVRNGAEVLMRRLNGLMDYCRIEQAGYVYVWLDLAALADRVVNEVFAGAEGQVRVTCCAGPVWLRGDEQQLRILLHNLLTNARKYHKPNLEPNVEVAIDVSGEAVRVDISDDGIGFDTSRFDDACRMFRRLVSDEDYAGTGVGLALCDRIARRHGARLSAVSSPGAGACFSVEFPLCGGVEQ